MINWRIAHLNFYLEDTSVKTLIAIVGQSGSGKNTVANYILAKRDSTIASVEGILINMCLELYLEQSRENVQSLAEGISEKVGPEVLTIAALKNALMVDAPLILYPGMRYVRQLEYLKTQQTAFQTILIAVDATKGDRFMRVRESRRQYSDEPGISLEKFNWLDSRSTELEIPRLMELADYIIPNFSDKASLLKAVDAVLEKIFPSTTKSPAAI